MTEIVCKCGVSRLEDVQCAECGAYFKAGWIPVSEPPNTDGLYLASLDNGGVEIVEYWLGGWMMKLDEDWTRTELPTHWMPLPQPPEAE